MFDLAIIGADGLIGDAISSTLIRDGATSILKLGRSKPESRHAKNTKWLDISDLIRAERLLGDASTIFICSGYKVNNVSNQTEEIYYDSERRLVLSLIRMKKNIVYFSSNKVNLIYENPNFALPPSFARYLQHKKLVEEILLPSENCIVFRLGKVIHRKYSRYLQWIQAAKSRDKIDVPINAFHEPVALTEVVKFVIGNYNIKSQRIKIFQASDSISYYQGARCLFEFYFQATSQLNLLNPIVLPIGVPKSEQRPIDSEILAGSTISSNDGIKKVVQSMIHEENMAPIFPRHGE